jgi:hypothetical protein
LKPDASPKPTEVGWVQLHRALERRDAYLVRMIKPNLIFSHNWHVQPNCQRSLRVIRLSGTLWDRGPAFQPGCPRTCCAHRYRFNSGYRCFCANLSNISKSASGVKPNLSSPKAAPTHCWRSILAREFRSGWSGIPPGKLP